MVATVRPRPQRECGFGAKTSAGDRRLFRHLTLLTFIRSNHGGTDCDMRETQWDLGWRHNDLHKGNVMLADVEAGGCTSSRALEQAECQ